ncbi:putative adrenodoxin-type ferredoxin [Besnoitia besnoiti]|uniref:2Fe-2S ferredoxin n=1 Tax=Besnoitia besnoiti TaxID=94643 RepID=A0A2A9ML45_BESBE|nr:putative adrenodoxin-type ferredoxin [Besnoitia besnoiti]PFH36347.1 putative adrenodoxin-type ferredoxin [Besnoitia besnoiti]
MILRPGARALAVALSSGSRCLRRSHRDINVRRQVRPSASNALSVPHTCWLDFRRLLHALSSNPSTVTGESAPAQTITLTFILPDNSEKSVQAKIGDTILEVAHANDIPLEGACEGSCSCSTCHVILDQTLYDELPEPSEDEEDMLDLAACLTPTSRLGCQIHITPDLDGAKIRLPQLTRNFYVDGHVPSPH